MNTVKLLAFSAAAICLVAGPVVGSHQAMAKTSFIAGTTPDRRPEGAPVIKEGVKGGAWYTAALHGVVQPYPYSLRFLEDQGNWFSPFIHAGMSGPYDIRNWHK
jgi:hypothetical protein